jgi:hypothetical protein
MTIIRPFCRQNLGGILSFFGLLQVAVCTHAVAHFVLQTCNIFILGFLQNKGRVRIVRIFTYSVGLIRKNPWIPRPIAFGLRLRLCCAVLLIRPVNSPDE